MVTRSIVGRFLILAVLIVSLGVIAQAALIMTRSGDKKATLKTASAQPAASDVPGAAPVRVVYPGPLADASAQPRKTADTASASPLAAAPFGQPAAPITQPVAPIAQTVAPVQESTVAAPATADMPAAPSAAAFQAVATPAMAAQPIPVMPATAAPAATPAPATTPPAAAAPVRAAAPVVVASIDPGMKLPNTPAPTAHAADGAPSGKGININSAPAAVLDHLHGGGRIGQTIVGHRPYRSAEDLVTKRVLRRSVYEQIKRQIATQ